MKRLFGPEYVQGYTAALQDVLATLESMPEDLKMHKRKQNIATLKAIVKCMLENRVVLREVPGAFIRCNNDVPGGFEVYIEKPGGTKR